MGGGCPRAHFGGGPSASVANRNHGYKTEPSPCRHASSHRERQALSWDKRVAWFCVLVELPHQPMEALHDTPRARVATFDGFTKTGTRHGMKNISQHLQRTKLLHVNALSRGVHQ